MSEMFSSMNDQHQAFIQAQHMFFVATAPLDPAAHVNTSPKGLDCFRILTANKVAYLDATGSGNETSAHIRENGRITFMFCAFDGAPKILRLYGTGRTVLPGTAEWDELVPGFELFPGARQIIVADIHQVQKSCGYAVPRYDFIEHRDTLNKWAEHHGDDSLVTYRATKNRCSIDGMLTVLGEQVPEAVAASSIKL
jgi:hypothetical protein